ncbi:MAG TPA: GAF domain-containing protein [Armatimonadota bacterium]|jgi:two-component sensor histidine kinase
MPKTELNPRRAMDRIAYQTISSHSLKDVLDAVTHGLTEEMGAALARIWLLQPNSACAFCLEDDLTPLANVALHLYASAGLSTDVNELYHRMPLCHTSISAVAFDRRPVLRTDVAEHRRDTDFEWIRWEGIQSLAAYPLMFRGEVLGILAMLSTRILTQDEFEALGVFAAQATVAIQNALLFEEAARARADLECQVAERTADLARKAAEAENRAAELAALNGVAQMMARSMRSDEIATDVLQTVLAVTGLDAGIIHLEEDGRLRVAAVAGLPALADKAHCCHDPNPDLCVLQRGEATVLSEMEDPGARICYDRIFGRPVDNAASVPITARGRTLGVLSVASVHNHEFTVRDLQLLRSICQQVGLALDNARLLHAAEERSELLATAIQETHHRVKNNLQAISSLLEMHLMQPGDLRAGMHRVTDQVRAIALVHDFLSQDADVRGVSVRPVLESLVPAAISSHRRTEQEVRIVIEADDVVMPSKEATSLALIVTELVANAVEHGLAEHPNGIVRVRLHSGADGIVLEVHDDGKGLPQNFDPERDGHLGTELVLRLARRHLKGSVAYLRDNGTVVRVTLPGGKLA